MKLNKSFPFILILFVSLILIQPLQAKDRGQEAYNAGKYELALKIWSKAISKYERRNKTEQCPYFTKAGAVAYKLGKMNVARKYLEAARYSVSKNATTYNLLAQIYRKIDNLSKEIDALEYYVKHYPKGKYIDANRKRLFVTYVESENWDKGLKLWPEISSEVQGDITYETGLLKTYVGLKMDKKALLLAQKIIKRDPKNISALSFLGKYFFWLAENSYQAENKAYAANRTNRQYAHLLRAYKVITVNFKKSLYYFQDLYNLKPTAKVAVYLADIYARLSNKKKADYYHKISKKLK